MSVVFLLANPPNPPPVPSPPHVLCPDRVQHRYPQHVFEAFVSALQQFEMERISEVQLAVSCAQLLAGDRMMLQVTFPLSLAPPALVFA